jgi:hypothetical protein
MHIGNCLYPFFFYFFSINREYGDEERDTLKKATLSLKKKTNKQLLVWKRKSKSETNCLDYFNFIHKRKSQQKSLSKGRVSRYNYGRKAIRSKEHASWDIFFQEIENIVIFQPR